MYEKRSVDEIGLFRPAWVTGPTLLDGDGHRQPVVALNSVQARAESRAMFLIRPEALLLRFGTLIHRLALSLVAAADAFRMGARASMIRRFLQGLAFFAPGSWRFAP